jgi:hypothetical protein
MRPVRSAGSPEHSHRATSAKSSGDSISSRGTPRSRPWYSMPGVATRPVGASTLTAMPSAWTSAARPVVNRSSAALHMP